MTPCLPAPDSSDPPESDRGLAEVRAAAEMLRPGVEARIRREIRDDPKHASRAYEAACRRHLEEGRPPTRSQPLALLEQTALVLAWWDLPEGEHADAFRSFASRGDRPHADDRGLDSDASPAGIDLAIREDFLSTPALLRLPVSSFAPTYRGSWPFVSWFRLAYAGVRARQTERERRGVAQRAAGEPLTEEDVWGLAYVLVRQHPEYRLLPIDLQIECFRTTCRNELAGGQRDELKHLEGGLPPAPGRRPRPRREPGSGQIRNRRARTGSTPSARDRRAVLGKIIASLSEPHRTVLGLSLQGLTNEAIAARMGIPYGTACLWKARALAELERRLRGRGWGL